MENQAAKHDPLLRSVSRSFHLSVKFLPAPMREAVSLSYLLARASDTLADADGFPTARRLEALSEFRAAIDAATTEDDDASAIEIDFVLFTAVSERLPHRGEAQLLARLDELLPCLANAPENTRPLLREVLLTILEGQRWDLKHFAAGETAAPDADALLLYTHRVAGCVGEFWTRAGHATLGDEFADEEKLPDLLRSGRALGQGLQLINILRDLHEDLPAGRCYLPEDELRKAGWDGEWPPPAAQVAPVFRRWLERCREFLREGSAYPALVKNRRVRFSTALPLFLAEATADRLQATGPDTVLRHRIKATKGDLWKAVFRAMRA